MGGVIGASGKRLDLYPAARRVLLELWEHGIPVVVASASGESDVMRELLRLLRVDRRRSMADVVMLVGTVGSSRAEVLAKLEQETGVAYSSMLMFDRMPPGQPPDVAGPTLVHMPCGLTREAFEEGLREHASRQQSRQQGGAEQSEAGGRRLLDAGRRLLKPAETGALAAPRAEDDAWFDEWCANVQQWWLSVGDIQAQLGTCFAAFGLHLGSRLEQAYRSAARVQGGSAAPRSAETAADGCEWVREAGELELPSVPNFPLEFKLPPIPRLLPDWRWLQSLGPASAPLHAGLLAFAQRQQRVVPTGPADESATVHTGNSAGERTLLFGAGAGVGGGLALALGAALWIWGRQGRVSVRSARSVSHAAVAAPQTKLPNGAMLKKRETPFKLKVAARGQQELQLTSAAK